VTFHSHRLNGYASITQFLKSGDDISSQNILVQ